ncbi:MAG: hypothetical protein JWN79_1542 [Gemmatimonadetes bacterium]|nr:hypothetical protein [Gemmatimonadota bacterium]
MHVVFAADRAYAAPLAVAMRSLFRSNPAVRFQVHVLNADIDPSTWAKLAAIAREHGHVLTDARIRDDDLRGIVLTHHFARSNYYRLFSADKVPADRALYLDADVIVRGDVRPLRDAPLGDAFVAAVENRNFSRHRALEMSPGSRYFNSGVMVMNLVRWRADGLAPRVLAFVRRKAHAIEFVDQCGLNGVIDGRWLALHPRFNVQSDFHDVPYVEGEAGFSARDMAEALDAPVIVHFTGNSKPWQLLNAHPYKREYWRHLRATPFRQLLPDGTTPANVVRRFLPAAFKVRVRTAAEMVVRLVRRQR